MAPRHRRTYYRLARRTVRRRPARRRSTSSGKPAIVIVALLFAIGSPAYGVPILLLITAGLWLTRPGVKWHRLGGRRPASIAAYQTMSPTQFEHALADLCRRDGCRNVRVVGGAGDLAADVIATVPDGRRIVIQAKRYAPSSTVGSGDVQKVNGTYRDVHHAQIAAIITTSQFTQPALELATRVGIRTYDQHALANWASGGPAPWN